MPTNLTVAVILNPILTHLRCSEAEIYIRAQREKVVARYAKPDHIQNFYPSQKNTTQEYPKAEEIVIAWFKMQIRALCGENIQNLADAPSFCHTTRHKPSPLRSGLLRQ